VRDQQCGSDYLRLVEARNAYLLAMVRVRADEAKQAREASQETT